MKKQKAGYGFDAPKLLRICTFIVLTLICIAFTFYLLRAKYPIMSWIIIGVLIFGICCVLYPVITIIIGSRILKFRERDWLLDVINIKGDERILDVGCGRGLLLIGAAKKLKIGKAIGIDIWRTEDQTNNTQSATLHNARIEGVEERVEVVTADARQMPFESESFDMVISSWALHNIVGRQEREKALKEMLRVLKPHGTIAIMDIEYSDEYVTFFKRKDIEVTMIGPRFTFGNPTYIVQARKKV